MWQACVGEMSGNEGCGGHMSTTEHAGGFRGRKGCCRRAIFMPKRPRRTKCTGQQEKEQEQANCQMPKKVGQPKKAESKIKIVGKMKKKKETKRQKRQHNTQTIHLKARKPEKNRRRQRKPNQPEIYRYQNLQQQTVQYYCNE